MMRDYLRPGLTLNQLLTFAAIAKHLNISRASAELHVSQSSLTQQIRKLEKEFKVKLYRKIQRGVVLTEDGEAFLRHAKRILKEIQELSERFRARRIVDDAITLRVGGSFAPSASFLPQVLAAFRKRHPEVQLALKTHDSVTLERMLLRGELDIAVINHRPTSADLVAETYRRENLVIFASAHHPLAKKQRLDLRELAGAPLVIREAAGSTTLIERMLREAELGIRPNIVLRCESPAAVKTAVKNNMGIGVLFSSSVKADIRNGTFKKLKLSGADLNLQTYIAHRKEPLSQVASDFIGALRQRRNSA